MRRKILKGALFGAIIGALAFFIFGDGWLMGLFLAGEGIIMGGAAGCVLGLLWHLVSRNWRNR